MKRSQRFIDLLPSAGEGPSSLPAPLAFTSSPNFIDKKRRKPQKQIESKKKTSPERFSASNDRSPEAPLVSSLELYQKPGGGFAEADSDDSKDASVSSLENSICDDAEINISTSSLERKDSTDSEALHLGPIQPEQIILPVKRVNLNKKEISDFESDRTRFANQTSICSDQMLSPRLSGIEKDPKLFRVAERAEFFGKSKENRILSIRQKHQVEKDLTFKPKLNQKSLQIASSVRRTFLLSNPDFSLANFGVEGSEGPKPDPSNSEFNSKIAPQTDRVASPYSESVNRNLQGSFASDPKFSQDDTRSHSFATNKSDSRRKRSQSWAEEKLSALSFLYDIPLQRKQQKEAQDSADKNDRSSFVPKINPRSARIAKSLSRASLQSSESKKKETLLLEKETKEMQECSFRPKINSNFCEIQPSFGGARTEETLRLYQERQIEMDRLRRRVQEFYQLRDCPFRPSLAPKVKGASVQLTDVKGVSSFFKRVNVSLRDKRVEVAAFPSSQLESRKE